MFPSVEVLPVVSGHALGCFCHSYGRFLGILLLPKAYHTYRKAQECSSCSTGIIVSPAAAGFPLPARAGGSRRSHIPSSPHQRHGPQRRQQRLPAPSPPKNQLLQGFKGTQPRAQPRSAAGLSWVGCSARRCGRRAGCSCWVQNRCAAVLCFPRSCIPLPAPSLLPAFLSRVTLRPCFCPDARPAFTLSLSPEPNRFAGVKCVGLVMLKHESLLPSSSCK